MKGHDYMPQGDEEFLAWSRNFIALIVINAAAWGIPHAVVTLLQSLFDDYEAKPTIAASGNHGKADVAAKNAAKKALMHEGRSVVKTCIARNPAVSAAQKEALGVTVYGGTRTPIPAPKSRPEFSFKVLGLMRIQIDFRDQGSGHRAIPYGYNGAVFCYAATDAAVGDYECLTKSVLLTRSPWTLTLPPGAEGKVLSGALMRRNGKGRKGPWSEILPVIIP
ncbi:MAG: hypothetical protein LBB61_00165 [Treponema sp.]|jgi:hypothetical protein|nr:hypothetical protein [Treponema sp.]